jgi:hypothetical protein
MHSDADDTTPSYPFGGIDTSKVGLLHFRGCHNHRYVDLQKETEVMGKWGQLVEGKSVTHPSVFARFTDATRKATDFAWQETMRRRGSEISVADLLAGLSVEENTRAERVGSLKANSFYLRWLVGLPALPTIEAETTPVQNMDIAERIVDFDPEAKRALAFAVLEADRDRNYWIDSDHLLRGILRFPNKAHFALLKTEVNLNSARAASRFDRWENMPEQNPSVKVVRYLIRKYTTLLVPSAISLACYLYILFEGIGMPLSPLAR